MRQLGQELKAAEIQANQENSGMYVTYRGVRTVIQPNLPEMTSEDVTARVKQMFAAVKVFNLLDF